MDPQDTRPDQGVIVERLDALRKVIERIEEKFTIVDNWRQMFERDFITHQVTADAKIKALEERLSKLEGTFWKVAAFLATAIGGWVIARLLGLL
jgi:hypothetical protein